MPSETRSTCTFALLLIALAFLLVSGELRGERLGHSALKNRQDHVPPIHNGVRFPSRTAHPKYALDERKAIVSGPYALKEQGIRKPVSS